MLLLKQQHKLNQLRLRAQMQLAHRLQPVLVPRLRAMIILDQHLTVLNN